MKWQDDPKFPLCLDLRSNDGKILFGWVRKTSYGCWYKINDGSPRTKDYETVEDAKRGLWEETVLRTLGHTLE